MNRLTWVIGGTTGIGEACAYEMKTYGGRTVVATGKDVDVTESRELAHFLDSLDKIPDEVVYSAGIHHLDWIGNINPIDTRMILDVNVVGFINVLNLIKGYWDAERLKDPHYPGVPRIVAIGSDAATRPMRTSIAYCASKAALHMAVRCAARELGILGWRINCVAPGMTSGTEITTYIDEIVPVIRGWSEQEAYEYELAQSVIPRRAKPIEVAHLVHQVLEGPDYLNGEVITINGGR